MVDIGKNIEPVDFAENRVRHFGRHLTAIGAVGFISIILGGVVAGGNIDASVAR